MESDHSDLADRVLALPDGRRVGFAETGATDGHAVIALHGTPGSRLKFAGTDDVARAAGLRLIAFDRWGYGQSDACPGGRLQDYAADVAYVCDQLGITRFSVLGISGGGPFAVAIAAALPERVETLALVAPVGPVIGTGGLRIALSPLHAFCFRWLARSRTALWIVFALFRAALLVAPRAAVRSSMAAAPGADREAFSQPGIESGTIANYREGLRRRVVGAVEDLTLFAQNWEVAMQSVRAPAKMWIGEDDTNVSLNAALALGTGIFGCEVEKIPAAGHLWVVSHWDTVFGWIADARKESGAAKSVKTGVAR